MLFFPIGDSEITGIYKKYEYNYIFKSYIIWNYSYSILSDLVKLYLSYQYLYTFFIKRFFLEINQLFRSIN